MRWLLLAVFAIVLPTAAAPVPKHLLKDESFWPTTVGTKWVYVQDGTERTHEIIKTEALDGAIRLTVQIGPKGELEETVDVSPDGIVQRTLGKFKTDHRLLRFPIKVDDTWTFAFPIQKGLHSESGRMTVSAEEEIKVPAGTYRATKVVKHVTEVNGTPIERPYSSTYWYVKGVGPVKVEWNGGGRELKSFTPGKK